MIPTQTPVQTPMQIALAEAQAAAARGEVPVGAVITDATGNVIAKAGNRVEAANNPAQHAEMLVLTAASAALGTRYLAEHTLTVTLEPCAMCAGAIAAYRIKKLVFAAYDAKSGAIDHGPRIFTHTTTHHKPEIIGGMGEQAAAEMLQAFFAARRG
ncbi:MAG: nucleoside deaminase [Acidocella sp.]|nr:nucleoside deaminase [Acidocella sp.]